MKSMNFLLLVFSVFFYMPLTLADEDGLFDESLPVVISASRLNQSVLTSPSSVTVIDKTMIEATGFTEIVDVLRLVPGFQVAHIDGRRYTAVYHGLGSEISNRMQILVNGRSTYTSSLSTINWDMIGVQLIDVERLEVVRSSSASAYGSNSFTAAVNIITKAPELDDAFYVHQRTGSNNENEQLIRFSDSEGDFNYRLTVSQRENDGLDDIRDSRDFKHFSYHGHSQKNPKMPLELFLTYTGGDTGTEVSDEALEERDVEVSAWSVHTKGKYILSSTQDVAWNVYHQKDRADDLAQTLPWSQLLGTDPVTFETATGTPDQSTIEGSETTDASKTDFELVYNASSYNNISYVIGTGVRYDAVKSISYFKEKGTVTDTTYRTFFNSQIHLADHVDTNMGAIYEYVDGYGGKVSSRLTFNWQAAKSQSFRLAYSKGYRLPSLLERNFDTRTTLDNGFVIDERYLSDDNIQPEEIHSYELGYLGKSNYYPISWDVKLYHDKFAKLIDYPQDRSRNDTVGDYYRFVTNTLEYETYGVEGELIYRPRKQYFIKFHFNNNYNESQRLKTVNPDQLSESYGRLFDASYSLIGSVDINSWQLSTSIFYTNKTRWYSVGELVDGYTRKDINVKREFSLGNTYSAGLAIGAQNIGNKHIEFDKKYVIEPSYYLKLSIFKP